MGKGDRYAKFSLSGGKSTMPERPCRRGDWRKASAALRDRNGWKGEYVGRRYQEGTLLMEVC